MEHPRLVNGLEPASSGGYLLRITWDPGTGPGAALPDAYFANASVDSTTPAALASSIESMSLTGKRELSVSFRDNPSRSATAGAVVLTLLFPDRNEHIDCSHPGISDAYMLHVMLRFDASGRLSGSELEETVRLGPI